MTQSRTLKGAAFRIALTTAMIAGLIFITGQTLSFPQEANTLFGPSNPALTLPQQIKLSYQILNIQDQLLYPTNLSGDIFSFVIEPNEDVANITQRLESHTLISSANALNIYLVYTGLDTRIQAGTYSLSSKNTPVEIANMLLDNAQASVPFVILPGWRLEEIAAALPTSGLNITQDQFLKAASKHPAGFSFLNALPAQASLEGFFSPGTYSVPRTTNANGLVTLFLSAFQRQLTTEILIGFEAQGLSLYDAVKLGSIVEREALVDDEKPMIASVYLNRLNINMQLAADPTVQYAIGYNAVQTTWWTNPLSLDNLKIDSAYNTYIYLGLPPTPIANPTLNSLLAVAFPETTPYYFFRATCDNSGRHAFAITYDEHLANACQ